MEEAGGDTTVVTGGEEELVVDEPSGGGEFIVDSGQLPGLDTLILDSIERCGKYHVSDYLIDFYELIPVLKSDGRNYVYNNNLQILPSFSSSTKKL